MTIHYSDMPDQPRLCRFCGADTAPGQLGHDGSEQHFDEMPCERHQEDVYAEGEAACTECTQQPWYICGTCTGNAGQQGERMTLDEALGTSDGSVH